MKIKFLEAYNGDAIHISFSDKDGIVRNILVDGGVGKTYRSKAKKKTDYNALYETIEAIREQNKRIDLLILTHVDDDHIAGILKWLNEDKEGLDLIDKIWFNSGRLIKEYFDETENLNENDVEFEEDDDSLETSISQGLAFEQIIKKPEGIWEQKIISKGYHTFIGNAEIKVLSPDRARLKGLVKKWEAEDPGSLDTSKETDFHYLLTDFINGEDGKKEDNAVHNGSSIAFLLIKDEINYLFLADAHPSVVVATLNDLGIDETNPLNCKIVKLSHHGSMYNNSIELLSVINSDNYVISTNSDIHGHPHKQMIARLIKMKGEPSIHFNYPELIDEVFRPKDFEDYPFLKNISKENTAFNF